MKNSLYHSLLSRLRNKHNKMAVRFQKSIQDGEFQKQRYRKRRDSVERLKSLEKRISKLGKESGFKVALNYKHWAVALAMGVVVSASAQDKEKKKFKERYGKAISKSAASKISPLAASFSDPVTLGNAYLTNFLTGDLDGDGDTDGIYISYVDNPIIFINESSFNFTQVEIPVNSNGLIENTVLGDFDGDGSLDLFLQEGIYGGPISTQIWLNDGDGNLTSNAGTFPTVDLDDDIIFAVDIDGDGDDDLIGETQEDVTYNNFVTVFPNDNLDFSDSTALKGSYSTSPSSRLLTVTDVDGDTDIDIVYSAQVAMVGNALHVLGNDGLGNFSDAGNYLTLTNSFYDDIVTALDFDNDGDFDIAGFISISSSIYVRPFLNDGTILSDATSNFTEGTPVLIANGFDNEPDGIYAATINPDAFDDFVAHTEDSTFVFSSDGSGGFSLLSKFAGQSKPGGDIDGNADGVEDLFFFDGNATTLSNNGTGTAFTQNDDLAIVSSVYDVKLVDLDGDGDLDFVEAGGFISRTWLNDGNGNFTLGQEMPGNAYYFAFGDLDGDGDPDMLKSYEDDPVYGTPGGIELWTNTDGVLTVADTLGQGVISEEAVIHIDFLDADSDLDIAVYYEDGCCSKYLATYSNDGGLAFSSINNYFISNEVGAVTFGDVDGDMDVDALVGYSFYTYGVVPFLNNGSGNLVPGTAVSLDNSGSITDIDLADFDGDLDLDFVIVRELGAGTNVDIFFNDDTTPGTFPTSSDVAFAGYTYRSFVGDTDNDGDIDIIFGGYATKPEIWENDGTGSFTSDTQLSSIADEYTQIAFGDLDDDGDEDVAFGGYYTGTKIFFNLAIENTASPLENDSTALVNFYNDMGGESWTDNTNWLVADQNLEDWFGVTLNTEGDRVESVELPNNGLTGSLSAEINNLDALITLDVSNNTINALGTNFSGLTNATSIVLDGNELDFTDLEAVAGISGITYAGQTDIGVVTIDQTGPIEIPAGTSQPLSGSAEGSSISYQWALDGTDIPGATEATYTVSEIGRDNQGTYSLTASNALVPGLTFTSSIDVFGTAIVTVNVLDADDDTTIPENVNAYLFRLSDTETADTVDFAMDAPLDVTAPAVFPEVILGDFIVAIESVVPISDGQGNLNEDAVYIPTYFGDQFESTLADTLLLADDSTITITMVEVPPERTEVDGTGVVSGTIDEDFPEDGSRLDARRRAARRKCGLKKRRTGGRPGQEEFDLIAYGETNDNGEFEYGFLAEGTYRFFVEYPGIPLDESAFVEFVIGESGVTDDSFVLAVFASPDGIQIELVLGITSEYFTDFSIYPNPTTDLLNIEYSEIKGGDMKMEIVNLEGKTFMNRSLDRNQNKVQLDTSILPPGMYLIKFVDEENANNQLVYRLIKK